MLNPFPDLLTYGLIAPFILRIIIGYLFINLGFLKLTKEKGRWNIFFESIYFNPPSFYASLLGIIEIIGGLFLLTGFSVQITALVLGIITLGEIIVEYKEPSLVKRDLIFYLLIFTIVISLIFSGAGFFAFDRPL